MSESIRVDQLDGLGGFDRDHWNSLVAACRTATVFQTFEWHCAWWDVYGPDYEPLLLRAIENGELVGIAPLALHRDRKERTVVRFMGHPHSDYADIICADDRDDVRYALLSKIINPRPRWDRLDLWNIPANSPTERLFERLESSAGKRCLMVKTTLCPTLIIRGHEKFFKKVRNKKSLRRHQNYFKKQPGYAAEHFSDAAHALPLLDLFFAQHIDRWAQTPSPSLFIGAQNREFYQAMVTALDGTGWLRFTRVVANGEPIAFHLGFAYRGRFMWYKPTFNYALARRSPGEALLKELLEQADVEGHAEFDFTIGNEAFKQRFTNHLRRNVSVAGYSNRAQFEGQRAYIGLKNLLNRSRPGRAVLTVARNINSSAKTIAGES